MELEIRRTRVAIFDYLAETSTGARVAGQLNAVDEAAARSELESRGLEILSLSRSSTSAKSAELGDEQVGTLVHAVGTASANRIPLEIALAALAEEKDDPRLAQVAQELATRLAAGETLDEAATALGRRLPTEIQGLMRAGIQSGDLAGTFERFAAERMTMQRAMRRLRSAIAYPLLIAVIMVPILLFLSVVVIPMFAEIYEDFDLQLPALTEILLQTADQMPALIGSLLLMIVVLPLVLRAIGGRWLLHRVLSATPLVGRLWMWSGQREFAGMLASFLDQRFTMEHAIRHTSEVIRDRNVARACRRVIERLQAGQPLSACLGQSMHFDRALVALVAWGEAHALVPEALRIATEVFDDRIDQHAFFVYRLVPPVTLVVVTSMMFMVVVGLMVPLVKLIEGLMM